MPRITLEKKIHSKKPETGFFTRIEKDELIQLVQKLVDMKGKGLGDALTALWKQQKHMGFILGNPRPKGAWHADDFLYKEIGSFTLVYSPARKHRGDVRFLIKRGILSEHPRFVYELYEKGSYSHYPEAHHEYKDKCFLCSADGANPNEILLPQILCDAEFIYGANFATLGHSHFTLWTRVPLLQTYWSMDTLQWLCCHGDKLQNDDFTTFFNGLGAGNSIRHYHYQTLREPFPIFNAEIRTEFKNSKISRLEWPMPAYRMDIHEKENRCDRLSYMDALIQAWLQMSKLKTFNLAHRTAEGISTIIFIPRVNIAGKCRPSEIGNNFGGCEVCGRINIEDKKDFVKFKKSDAKKIEDLMEELAPRSGHIDWLESHLS